MKEQQSWIGDYLDNNKDLKKLREKNYIGYLKLLTKKLNNIEKNV